MTKDKDLTVLEKFKEQLNIPKTETRIILETQDLYPDLVHEDIGSGRGYGPCLESGCRCNKQQLREQIRTLENKLPYAPEAATFNLTISLSQSRTWNFHFKQRGGGSFNTLQMWSIEDARNRLSQLRNQDLWVHNAAGVGSSVSQSSRIKQDEVISVIESYISQYNSNQSVSANRTIYN